MSDQERRFLTPAETAKLLRVAEPTVYRALQEGRLPAAKLLGRWRIFEDELGEWIENQRVPRPKKKVSSTQEFMDQVAAMRESYRS